MMIDDDDDDDDDRNAEYIKCHSQSVLRAQ